MNKNEYTKISIVLPLPISVNAAYATNFSTKRRFKTTEYKNWEREALLYCKSRYEILGDNWVDVRYTYFMPIYNKNGTKKKIDVFNYEKCLSDFIPSIIKGFDDSFIKEGTVKKVHSDKNIVIVTISELSKEDTPM